MVRGGLRFVKWKKTQRGRFVAKCMGMKRLQVSEEEGYRFRCMSCQHDDRTWVWPADGISTTLQRAPLEVRLHVLEHHPDRRWAKTWATRQRRRKECPNCGFNLASYKIPEKDVSEEPDEDEY
jgi:hypothetical protein